MASMKDPLSSRKVQILRRRSLLQHPRRLRRRSICPFPDLGQRLHGVPFFSTSSEPEAEGDPKQAPSCGSSSWADGTFTLMHLSGLAPKGNVPLNEIRKTPPFTRTTVPCPRQAVMPCFGVVFTESSR